MLISHIHLQIEPNWWQLCLVILMGLNGHIIACFRRNSQILCVIDRSFFGRADSHAWDRKYSIRTCFSYNCTSVYKFLLVPLQHHVIDIVGHLPFPLHINKPVAVFSSQIKTETQSIHCTFFRPNTKITEQGKGKNFIHLHL
jgi:hypothetical protein